MKFGAGFPLRALDDAAAIRDYAQTLEGAGFDFTRPCGRIRESREIEDFQVGVF